MSNPELDEIMTLVQSAISRAYALGRLGALKHVITTMEAEEAGTAGSRPLALMAPASTPQPSEPTPEPAFAPSPEPALAPVHENPAQSRVTVVQAHPDRPAQDAAANDDRASVAAAEAPIQLPWYRRPVK